jgi:transcription-repair coupling factor (superfamily II helicase)
VVVLRDWASEAERIKGAFAVARDLAEKAQAAKG